MKLPSRTFTQLVQDMSAVVQGSTSKVLDLSVGSVMRSILEANASLGLWMQWLILRTLQLTRAATSSGEDLDSWVADFALERLPAVAARGEVSFSRYATNVSAFIPAGTVIRTSDGGRTFTVSVDSTRTSWSVAMTGYVIPIGVAGIDVPAVADNGGMDGNVLAGTITMISSALPSVDQVSNAFSFVGGADAESDDNLRRRFRNYINSRSRATRAAIGYAIDCIRPGLTYVIDENVNTIGGVCPGTFTVTLDDGSGMPSPALISDVTTAIDVVRPIGSLFTVRPPNIVRANVNLTATYVLIPVATEVRSSIIAAVGAFVDGLKIGEQLSTTRLAEAIYRNVDGVITIANITINNVPRDLVVTRRDIIALGNVMVN